LDTVDSPNSEPYFLEYRKGIPFEGRVNFPVIRGKDAVFPGIIGKFPLYTVPKFTLRAKGFYTDAINAKMLFSLIVNEKLVQS
jgi:hypothetical protein